MVIEKQKTNANATRKSYAELEREVQELRALNARLGEQLIKAHEARYEQLKAINAQLKEALS